MHSKLLHHTLSRLSVQLVDPASLLSDIQHLLFDSRHLQFPETTLFFAIVGQRNDGHAYIPDLYAKGVRAFVVSDKTAILEGDAVFYLVEDTLRALQQLAQAHRQQFELEVIGITGSNGKTIVKEWLFQLLQTRKQVVRSPKSYNSQIGVPLSVWQIEAGHEVGIFEAGISQTSEMQYLAPIITCQVGIFTNIGSAHAEGFTSKLEKINEKMQLFQAVNCLIYCQDDPLIHAAVQQRSIPTKLAWSYVDSAAPFYISSIQKTSNSSLLTAIYEHKEWTIRLPFVDEASLENAIHCWVYLVQAGYRNAYIQEQMRRLEPVAMRLELKSGRQNSVIIDDSYNSDLESLRIALHFMQQQGNRANNSLILSDMLQMGLSPKKLYKKVAALINQSHVDTLIGIGQEIPILENYLDKKIKTHFYVDTVDFLKKIHSIPVHNRAILIKGARQFGFERISNRLAQKVHQTVLEVNLTALSHNLRQYTQRLKPETKVMVMVKASAYGSGSFEVARLLESQQVDYLGVAYADEGVELRKAGITIPILVLNSEAAVFDTMIAHALEPEIYSLQQLKQLLAILPFGKKYPIHLNLDTGMKRLGFEAHEIADLIPLLQEEAKIHVQSIFSHLAASESKDFDSFSKRQIALYDSLYQTIVRNIAYKPWRHILNSSGILRFPQYQMDMVRLGIGLYGVDSSHLISSNLQVVNSLKASVSQIKNLSAKETVGYGRSGSLANGGRIATISIGYADGLLRQAGNGNYHVWVKGQRAPILGNVCMDMCMIDVSHIPDAQVGDSVEIFGKHCAVSQLAHSLNTIPYEIFTNISERVKRIYFQE